MNSYAYDAIFKLLPINTKNFKIKLELVYENAKSKNIIKEFLCLICGYLVLIPKICKECDQLFCKDCVENLGSENGIYCTSCEAKFIPGEIDLPLMKILLNLFIVCPSGCDSVMKYEELDNHLQICSRITHQAQCRICHLIIESDQINIDKHISSCLELEITCQEDGCLQIFKRKFKDEHFINCEYIKSNCEYCNSNLTRYQHKTHSRKECVELIRQNYEKILLEQKHLYENTEETLKERIKKLEKELNSFINKLADSHLSYTELSWKNSLTLEGHTGYIYIFY